MVGKISSVSLELLAAVIVLLALFGGVSKFETKRMTDHCNAVHGFATPASMDCISANSGQFSIASVRNMSGL